MVGRRHIVNSYRFVNRTRCRCGVILRLPQSRKATISCEYADQVTVVIPAENGSSEGPPRAIASIQIAIVHGLSVATIADDRYVVSSGIRLPYGH